MRVDVDRIGDGPIIFPHMDRRMGDNINGPSLIKVPDWISEPLGKYYLYFAHHDGQYIRLAYADSVIGPWRTHEPGVMPIERSRFRGHIASPDVHVDHRARQIRMYFHGADLPTGEGGSQSTRLALSKDGIFFDEQSEVLGQAYMRVVQLGSWYYGLAMPGVIYRSRDGLTNFEVGSTLFAPDTRHSALLLWGDRLFVFYTRVGDVPEHIRMSEIRLSPDWLGWRAERSVAVLMPEKKFEGACLPLRPSVRGLARDPMHELRDPAIFSGERETYLLYSVAGEKGIAIAHLSLSDSMDSNVAQGMASC
ncbi:MAG: hypothetical protein ACR2PG_14850 [Hyphomicrobiaceae bacterium]